MSARKRKQTGKKAAPAVESDNASAGTVSTPLALFILLFILAGCIVAASLLWTDKDNETSSAWSNHGIFETPCHVKSYTKVKNSKCVPQRCGSAVVDNFLTESESKQLIRLMDLGLSIGSGGAGPPSILDLVSGAVSEGTQFIDSHAVMRQRGIAYEQADVQLYLDVTDRIRKEIEETFNVTGLMLTEPTFFSKISGDKEAKTQHDEYWHSHIDTLQYPSFVYTSLMYLNTHGEDYTGGEFLFDDQVQVVVRPKQGKLLMFTSGKENPHHVEQVRSGERRAITIAYTCNPDEATPNFLSNLLHKQ